jgi:malate dehydrogenase (oxaloacetate-decarboxylating)
MEALRETSVAVAAAVAEAAAADGVAGVRLGGDMRAVVRGLMWEPDYRPVLPG